MNKQNLEDLNKPRLDPQRFQASPLGVAKSLSQEEAQQQLLELEAIYATAPIGLSFVDTQLRAEPALRMRKSTFARMGAEFRFWWGITCWAIARRKPLPSFWI